MKTIAISQFKNGSIKSIEDNVAEENILHLVINSEVSFDVIISPSDIKEFVYGNLYTEGFISDKEDVLAYKENIKKALISINVKLKDFSLKKQFLRKNYNIVWTECGSSGELKRLYDRFEPITQQIKIKGDDILKIPGMIKSKTELFKQTGAFHYAFLFDSGINLLAYASDIGRHNAVDKVLGYQLLRGGEIKDKLLYVTGRVSSDILLKCLRAKVPVIISKSALLDIAIDLANKYNICLIGFLRGKRFNIYSNPKAIIH